MERPITEEEFDELLALVQARSRSASRLGTAYALGYEQVDFDAVARRTPDAAA